MDGPEIRRLIDGAAFLFTNEYEKAMTETKTGWSDAEVLARVGVRVTTLGPRGRSSNEPASRRSRWRRCRSAGWPIRPASATVSGQDSSPGWRGVLGLERCAQIGSLLATYVLETVGPQEYEVKPGAFYDRFAETFGDDAAAEIGHLVDAGLSS